MQKKFRLTTAILSVICVVFVVEAAAPVASIGNSQFFWWLFMIVLFLLPYGLVSSELGTAYQGDGGLYDWIGKAYPDKKWGARAAWWYWINFPLWMASLAVMIPGLLEIIFGFSVGVGGSLLIQIAFIAIVTVIALFPVSENVAILNISAAVKVILALTVGILGVWYVVKNGFVNDMSPATFLPSFDLGSLSYISVILFNCLGFEIVCTFSSDMQNPKKQIPQAIIIGGIVIAAIYLFSGFGIGAAIPTKDISTDSGLLDAFSLLTGRTGGWFIILAAALFLITLFGNMVSWSMGVNSTACYAAEKNDMPGVFRLRRKSNGIPFGAALMNGIVASLVCVLGVFMDIFFPDSSLFWTFFALNLVMFLLSYVMVFPAFLRLRKNDPDAERPFLVPGKGAMLGLITYIPMILIIIAIIFTAIPLSFDAETLKATLPITIGSIVSVVLGEILIVARSKKHKN